MAGYCDVICRQVLLFVCSMSHIPPYLFLSREDDADFGDIGKHDFRSVLLQPMLSNADRFCACEPVSLTCAELTNLQ